MKETKAHLEEYSKEIEQKREADSGTINELKNEIHHLESQLYRVNKLNKELDNACKAQTNLLLQVEKLKTRIKTLEQLNDELSYERQAQVETADVMLGNAYFALIEAHKDRLKAKTELQKEDDEKIEIKMDLPEFDRHLKDMFAKIIGDVVGAMQTNGDFRTD